MGRSSTAATGTLTLVLDEDVIVVPE
ncbi:hypothetical protein A2U01_0099455, partial [Trifolium medium]|nr:hypothetical protein [Trifolium medium]